MAGLRGFGRGSRRGKERHTGRVYPRQGAESLRQLHPSDFEAELDGKAFCDGHLGEFKLSSVQVENLVDGDALYLQSLEALADEKGIKRLVIVPDVEKYGLRVREIFGSDRR